MTIVTGCDAIRCLGGQDLVGLAFAIGAAFFRISGLEETAATAATVIVGAVGVHFDKIFFAHHGFDHITQVFGHRIAVCFANELARILYGKFDLAFTVPLGIDLEFALTDPLGV